ncbi:MAG: DUF4911 domain-containing protein [Deltaproteobacteria bacterium]|nr:DUF4911 domain-containing protein [Deltaproteobacteria bacterium]
MHEMGHVVLILDRRDISYLRFIIEGYDGLGVVSTIDPHIASVCLRYPLSQHATIKALLAALDKEKVIKGVRWDEKY